MKKTLLATILVGFLVLPLAGVAAKTVLELHRLNHDIEIGQGLEAGDVTFKEGVIISTSNIDENNKATEGKWKDVTAPSPCSCYYTEANGETPEDLIVELNGSVYTSKTDCSSATPLTNIQGCYTKDAPMLAVLDLINTVSDWIFVLVLALSVIFILMGAIGFLTAAGSPQKVADAQKKIIWAAVGIAVAFLAKGIVSIVEMLIK